MKNVKKILIASDHAGYCLKEKIIVFLNKQNFEIENLGPNSKKSSDYPENAHILCKLIKDGQNLGILICGSGIGMSIVANRYQKIRAALCLNEKMVKLSRKHNNANVLVLGSRLISYDLATKCIIRFVQTSFEAGRHLRRLNKINTGL